MRPNQPFGIALNLKGAGLCVLLLLCLLLVTAGQAQAQVSRTTYNVYQPLVNPATPAITATTGSDVAGTIDHFLNVGNVVNNDITDAATLNVLKVAGTATLNVRDGGADYPGGTYAGFQIEINSLLTLLGGQLVITTYNNGVPQESFSSGSGLSIGLIGGSKGRIGFVTTAAFDEIGLSMNVGLLGGLLSSVKVNYAEVLLADPAALTAPSGCNTITPLPAPAANYTAIAFSGAKAAVGVSVGDIFSSSNPIENVVDANTDNFTTINSSLLSATVADSAYVSVRVPGTNTFPAGYFAGFDVANGTGLAQLDILSSGTVIATYKNGVFQEAIGGTNLLLSAPVLSSNGRTTVGFVTTKDFNEIRFITKNTAGVSLLSDLRIYNAVIKRFCAGLVLDACNTMVTLNSTDYPLYIDAANTGAFGATSLRVLGTTTDYNRIIDGNPATTAVLSFPAGATLLTTQTVAIKSALDKYPAGTYAGFDILFNKLVNASVLGNLTIQLLDAGAVKQTVTGQALLAGVPTNLLTDPSKIPVGVIANQQFDEIKLLITNPVDVNVFGSIEIADLVMQKNCATTITCNSQGTTVLTSPGFDVMIDGAKTGSGGLISVGNAILNPANVITSSLSDYAQVQVVANVAAANSIAVMAGKSVFPKGVFAGFLIRENSANPLVLLNLLKLVTITTYKRDAQGIPQLQESKTGGQLLGLTALLPLLGNDHGIRTVGFIPTLDYDEIQISFAGVADVGTTRTIDVFGAAIDTRIVDHSLSSLTCPLYKTNPDINYTTVNTPVTGNVKTNDMVENGSTYGTPQQVPGANGQQPGGGTFNSWNQQTGEYTFTATTPGVYSYTVNVCPPAGENRPCEPQNLTITVTDPGVTTNPPIANTDIAATVSPNPVTIDVLANDHVGNPGGTLTGPAIDKDGANGHAVISSGKVQYTPGEGFAGKDTVVYKITENGKDAKAYVIIEVKPAGVANSTSASDDFAVTKQGSATAVTGNVSANDIDPEGNAQAVAWASVPASVGVLTPSAGGGFSFMPAAGFTGTAQMVYTATDIGTPVASAVATLYVYVAPNGLNTLPDNNAGFKDLDIQGNVSTNDNVPSGTTYGTPVAIGTLPGTPTAFSMNTNGVYTFKSGTPGVYKYNVPVTNDGITVNELLTITILDPAVNTNPPVVMNDVAITTGTNPVAIQVNDNDKPGNTGGKLSPPEIKASPTHGSVVVNPADSSVTYTLTDAGFTGRDVFTYESCETPGGKCSIAEVVVTVKPAGTTNASAADDYMTAAKGSVDVAGNVSTNDGPGQTVTTTGTFTDANNNKLVLTGTGDYKFTPGPGFVGTASFVYSTSIAGSVATATLYVTVKDAASDLTPNVTLTPNLVAGATDVGVEVSILELKGQSTNGLITVRIVSSGSWTTNLAVGSKQGIWTYGGIISGRHTWTTTDAIAGAASSTFSFTARYTPPSTQGTEVFNAQIVAGSGGDTNANNDTDSERIKYDQ